MGSWETPFGTPTYPMLPPGRALAMACSIEAWLPTASMTTSAPGPEVRSRSAAAPSSPRASMMSSAPKDAGDGLPVRVPREGDDPLGAEPLGGQRRAEPHGAVADDGDDLARAGAAAHRGVVAGAHDVGEGQDRGEQLLGRVSRAP